MPHKNIRLLAGMPLLTYRIRSVRALAPVEDVWISTDSSEYAQLAEEAGACVPFLRPPELARDESSSAEVILHAMDHAEKLGREYEFLGLLEPTSPFLGAKRIREGLEMLKQEPAAQALVAVRTVHPSTFFVQPKSRYLAELARRLSGGVAVRRQDIEEEITPSGGLYLARWTHYRGEKTFYTEKTLALPVSDLEGLEIDEPLDWSWAEFLMGRHIHPEDLF